MKKNIRDVNIFIRKEIPQWPALRLKFGKGYHLPGLEIRSSVDQPLMLVKIAEFFRVFLEAGAQHYIGKIFQQYYGFNNNKRL